MRQTPTFSMSPRMVRAIAGVAARRCDSMSAVVRDAVRAYLGLDEHDLPQPAASESSSPELPGRKEPGS